MSEGVDRVKKGDFDPDNEDEEKKGLGSLTCFRRFITGKPLLRRLEVIRAFFAFRLVLAILCGVLGGIIRMVRILRFVVLLASLLAIIFGPPLYGSVVLEQDYFGLVHDVHLFFTDRIFLVYVLFAFTWTSSQWFSPFKSV
jgi:hypothetical protein